MDGELEALKAELAKARQELWDVCVACGQDVDGGDTRHLEYGRALKAAKDLREAYIEAGGG